MQEQLISFETAKLLHKIGSFDKYWGHVAYKKEDKQLYGDRGAYTDYPAPTQSLLQKWLREKHQLFINVYFDPITHYHYCKIDRWNDKPIYVLNKFDEASQPDFETYEEALEKGLQEALKLI